jgi:hypothetical protein
MISNLVNSCGAVLKFGFLPLFSALILYRFAGTYAEARVHLDCLDRLRIQNYRNSAS